jgi:hypothetical protein
MYQHISGDTVFTLVGAAGPTYTVSASASPIHAGTIQGAGAYPSGSSATLVAQPNAGWGFLRWTENGLPVSQSATYTFTVTSDRTLVAEFVAAYTITTDCTPIYGGTASGGGTFNSGASVTVAAAPALGFVFDSWTEFGVPVSSSSTYSFTATSDRALIANFAHAPGSVTFDFDNAPVHTSLPIDLTIDDLTAHLSATAGGFSIQPADTLGFTPSRFAGLCIYPNSVFPADLVVEFSRALTMFAILYSPQELGCDDSATMRVTAYMNAAAVATNTATASVPGTWPSETLSIVVPAGFNRVVVHYDAPPPTCQDWGPIFLADNMTVALGSPPCLADTNGNGTVDVDDLIAVILGWGPCAPPPTSCVTDINDDGEVNADDLVAVILAWGPCP